MKNYFIYIFSFWLVLLVGILGMISYPFTQEDKIKIHYANQRELSTSFLLTDFCFSTESRHVRHLSMPEWIAPFQDFPAYHEHFPSSSFFKPAID